MVVGLLLAIAGIGAACALIYRAAVYALPLAVGMWAGFAALHAGSGPLIAISIGFVTGAIVFEIGQSICASNLPRALRYAVILLFVFPAVWTGYCASREISTLFAALTAWQFVLGILGATSTGLTAFLRLTTFVASPRRNGRSFVWEDT